MFFRPPPALDDTEKKRYTITKEKTIPNPSGGRADRTALRSEKRRIPEYG